MALRQAMNVRVVRILLPSTDANGVSVNCEGEILQRKGKYNILEIDEPER